MGILGGGQAGMGCSRLESTGIGMGWHHNGARSPRAPWSIHDTYNKLWPLLKEVMGPRPAKGHRLRSPGCTSPSGVSAIICMGHHHNRESLLHLPSILDVPQGLGTHTPLCPRCGWPDSPSGVRRQQCGGERGWPHPAAWGGCQGRGRKEMQL